MKRAMLGKWTIGLLVLAALPALASETKRPNLEGTWKLDEDLTARMRESDRAAGHVGGFRGGMGRPPGGGPGGGREGGRRGGGGFPGGPPPGGGPGGPPPSMTALDTLTIQQQEGEVTITDQEGRVRTLKTDGSKVRDENGPQGPVELRTHWEKDGTLTVKVKPDEGPRRTESYVVSNDGKHLYLTVTMEGNGSRPAFKIRRAYLPAEE